MSSKSLDRKTAIVTGAAGDIGSAVTRKFLAEGACVLMVDINEEKARSAWQTLDVGEDRCAVHNCDISNCEAAHASIDDAVSRFGSLDILVNGAAATTPGTTVAELEP